jgi:hypothetical protein
MRPVAPSLAVLAVLALAASACSSGGSDDGGADSTAEIAATTAPVVTEAPETTGAPATTSAPETTAAPPATEVTTPATADSDLDVHDLLEALASDEMNGRDNQTPGSLLAQELLVAQLSQFAEPAFPDADGDAGYLQPYDVGTNVLAIIPGAELADEYVMVGAHYDHHGNDCRGVGPEDDICNGATDNAAGVAAAVNIARAIAADGPPRRSVIITLWDGEEDGLVGANHYVTDPVVPLDQTVAYVNVDIQGSNLLPSLATSTILVGAETGGENLVDSARQATEASTLNTVMLSLLFGQGRSDHAVLVGAGVPSVFLTDANSGCYHTVEDDIDVVDFAKLDQQVATAEALSRDLIATDTPPVFDPDAPTSSYEDAAELLELVAAAEPDFGLLGPEARAASEQYLIDLQAIVDAGPAAFDDAANGTVLGGAVVLVSALAELDCDAFIS